MPDRDRVLALAVPLLLTVAAAAFYFVRLGVPDAIVFDETYYVGDARDVLAVGVERGFVVHPPVGKWPIAAGLGMLGDGPVGWRAGGVLAGAGAVLLTYLLGLRLLDTRLLAGLAALLVATDGLVFVQARTAMLDIYLTLFVVLGAWLLVRGLQAGRRARWWQLGAGVALGLAVATKWSGVLALAAAGLVLFVWELARHRRAPERRFVGTARSIAWAGLAFVVVPVATYALTYLPWLVEFEHTREGRSVCEVGGEVLDPCAPGLGERLAGLARHHRAVWQFHNRLEADHPYRAPAYTWPIMQRPIVYYWESCPPDRAAGVPRAEDDGTETVPEPCVVAEGQAAEIIALGNPALWWGFLLATLPLAAGLAARDRRAAFVAAFWGMQFLPWLLVDRPVFFFYMTPVVPFLALGFAYAVGWTERPPRVHGLLGGALVGAAAGFALGLAAEAVAAEASSATRWVWLGAGWLAGAMAGAWWDRRRAPEERPAPAPNSRRTVWVAAAVALLAVALFVWFYPVLAAVPLDDTAIRQRWWLRSWI